MSPLASLGYMPSMDIPEISPIQMGGLWDSYITSSNLSSEQANKLREFITKVTNTDNELKMERGVIDNQIKQFYLHKLRVLPLLGNSTQPTEQLGIQTNLYFLLFFPQRLFFIISLTDKKIPKQYWSLHGC